MSRPWRRIRGHWAARDGGTGTPHNPHRFSGLLHQGMKALAEEPWKLSAFIQVNSRLRQTERQDEGSLQEREEVLVLEVSMGWG